MVIPPIKTWMKAPINSDEYLDGVESFIVFTHTSLGKDTRLRQEIENEEMSTFKRLVDGPDFRVVSYNSYQANGFMFCTTGYELTKTTQNSGVKMKALTTFRSSARDKNPIDREATYYGVVKQILELDYFDFTQTVFYCDWVSMGDNGCYIDRETNMTFVNMNKVMRSSKKEDEPFILASQASQVFYCKDPTRDGWNIVLESPKKLTKDADAYENPLEFEPRMNEHASSSALFCDT